MNKHIRSMIMIALIAIVFAIPGAVHASTGIDGNEVRTLSTHYDTVIKSGPYTGLRRAVDTSVKWPSPENNEQTPASVEISSLAGVYE